MIAQFASNGQCFLVEGNGPFWLLEGLKDDTDITKAARNSAPAVGGARGLKGLLVVC